MEEFMSIIFGIQDGPRHLRNYAKKNIESGNMALIDEMLKKSNNISGANNTRSQNR